LGLLSEILYGSLGRIAVALIICIRRRAYKYGRDKALTAVVSIAATVAD